MPRPETNTAPVNSPAASIATGQRLIAATRDTALARALQALADDISISVVDDLHKLTDEMLRHGSNLALIDAALVEAPLEGVVDALTTQFPDLRLMVAGLASEQNLLASRLADATVFRFVNKPASPQRLKLFLEAAARESGRRRAPITDGAPPRPPSKFAFVLAGLAAAGIAAAAAWTFWPHGAAARLNARDLGRVEEMLRQADTAMIAKRFAAFDGSSAAELYRDALQLDNVNDQARAGLDKAVDGAISRAERALADGKLDEANNGMQAVQQIAPGHAGLKQLTTQIDAETQRQLADTKARQQLNERQAQIRSAVEKTEARVQAGALLDPATDNATLYFQTAQDLSPGDPAVRTARTDLTAALVAAGEKAVATHHLPDARRYASAAGRINSSAQGLDALLRHIDEAAAPAPVTAPIAVPAAAPAIKPAPANSNPAPAPTTTPAPTTMNAPAPVLPPAPTPAPPVATNEPAPAAPQPAATAPAPAAVSDWVPGEGVVSAKKLKVLRKATVEYPEDALANLTSGWVEMEFVVAKDGSVKDVQVTASQPRSTFDNAAITAQRKYRYQPVLKDGQPVEQRARARIVFTATDER